MQIDIKKVMGNTPKDQYEAIRQAIKAQQEVLEALNIMQSAIDFPHWIEGNQTRMKEYLKRFCK